MERKELLGFIKNHEDLKQIIAEKEGKNYTNVKTTILAKYVDEYNSDDCGGCSFITPITMFIVSLEEEGVLEPLVTQLGYIKK